MAARSRKLIAGQVADLKAEGRRINRTQLRYIHENKTAAPLTASVRLGARAANASAKQLTAITAFGRALGLAFQVIDESSTSPKPPRSLGRAPAKMSPRRRPLTRSDRARQISSRGTAANLGSTHRSEIARECYRSPRLGRLFVTARILIWVARVDFLFSFGIPTNACVTKLRK